MRITQGAQRLRPGRQARRVVVGGVATAALLLTGAGLLTRTMLSLSDVNDGLKAQNVLTMEVPLGFTRPPDELRSTYDTRSATTTSARLPVTVGVPYCALALIASLRA